MAVIVVLSVLLVGASVAALHYYDGQTSSMSRDVYYQSQLDGMKLQIAADRTQVDNLNGQISTLNQRITQLESENPCAPDPGYSSCGAEIQSLGQQVQSLNSHVSSLTSQVNNLTAVVNLQKTMVIANSVTLTWASCGDMGQPGCTPTSIYIVSPEFDSFSQRCLQSACYPGYVEVNWTSTQPVETLFTASVGTLSSSTYSGSSMTGSSLAAFPGTGPNNGGFSGVFLNNACLHDGFYNLHCPGGTLTYNAVYVY